MYVSMPPCTSLFFFFSNQNTSGIVFQVLMAALVPIILSS